VQCKSSIIAKFQLSMINPSSSVHKMSTAVSLS
jgi:hypothetical protein